MSNQNYSNHRRVVPLFHFVLSFLLFAGFIASVINFTWNPANAGGHVSSALICLLFVCIMLLFWYCRSFPLKAQDRAIRAEESLKFFILTSKPLDSVYLLGRLLLCALPKMMSSLIW